MAKAPVTRIPFTAEEKEAALALGKIVYKPGTWAKRFGNDIASAARYGSGITDKQRPWLWTMVQKYRRQMPASILTSIPSEFLELNGR